MKNNPLKLSILDQSPAAEGETAADALKHTIELAQRAEEWGYHRFWVAEHHGSNRNMGSSPEVLMSHLLARTDRIRIGSGGVMLQHYSPYKVAENFNVLATLAPGRVDLGIGRGPGGMPRSTQALRPQPVSGATAKSLDEKVVELKQFLHNRLEEGHPLQGLTATPLPPQPADLFLLGATAASAKLAAQLAMPYVFALFLNGDEGEMQQAIDTYRRGFEPTEDSAEGSAEDNAEGSNPQAMLALPVIVADTDEEAAGYAAEIRVVRIRLESGRTFTVFSVEAAEEFGRQSGEDFTYTEQGANVIHGSPGRVTERLQAIRRSYRVDEVFVVTAIRDFDQRLHSYKLLSDAMLADLNPRTDTNRHE